MLRIRLFGLLQIFDNDKLLTPLTPPKVSSLLAYLLLRREHPASRDQAAFSLWPNIPEAEARSNLRRHLHLLRRSLPQTSPDIPWVNADHESLQWNLYSNYQLDLLVFDETAKRANSIIDRPNEKISLLQSAVNVYSDDLLEGFYEDWVLIERERLRNQYVNVLENLAAAQEATGDTRGAITTSKNLLINDPLREEVHRQLMQLYYWAGDRAAALRQYEECKRLLWEKFNVVPMAETRAISEAIADSQIIPRKISTFPNSDPVHLGIPTNMLPEKSGPAPNLESKARKTPSQPFRSMPTLRKLLVLLLVTFLFLAGIFTISQIFTRRNIPLEYITFSGPSVAQDTWLTPEFPDSTFDPGFPQTPFKDYTQAHLQYYGAGLDRFLIRFDLSATPANTKVETATLSIYFETWISDSGDNALQRAYPATVTAYLISQPWQVETTTFNVPWSQPGLSSGTDFTATALDRQLINGTNWLTFDITSAALTWLDQPGENWGVMLKITDATEGVAHYWLDTTEYPEMTRRPRLLLTYHSD